MEFIVDFVFSVLLLLFQSHEIHNLETYTQYLVSLQVFNPEGPGPATTVGVMTDEGGKYFSFFSSIFHILLSLTWMQVRKQLTREQRIKA